MNQFIASTVITAVVLTLTLFGPGDTHGQVISVPREHFFALEWQVQVEGTGHVIAGYLHNPYRHSITDVEVRVETFDASGQRIGETKAGMTGEVPAGDRRSFEVPVPEGGAAFGVTVHSFAFVPVQAP